MHEMRHNNYRGLYDNFIEVSRSRNMIATLQRQLMPNLVKGTLWLICGGEGAARSAESDSHLEEFLIR